MEGKVSARRVVALVLAAVLGWTAAARAQDEVSLRASAEVDPARPVLLGQVADLTGPAAEALAGAVVLNAWPGGEADWATLDVGAVKAALSAGSRVNWGRVSLNGSACTLRKRAAPAAPAPAAAQAPAAPASEAPTAGTVRSMVPGRVAQLVGSDEASVRVVYEDAAKDLLDTPTAGRVVEITPSGMADRLPLAVRVFEKDRIVAQGSVRVTVSVRREVLVAKNALKRGDTLDLKDASIETRWVGPTFQGAAPEDFGSTVRAGKLSPGQLITDADLTPAVVVRKGEMVSVSCVAGSVVVRTMARAGSDARRGEVIRFEGEEKSDKGKDRSRRVFLARVAGPGRAVTVAASAEEPAPQEAAP